jgi:hypothetical protein
VTGDALFDQTPAGWVPYSPTQQSGHQGAASEAAEMLRRKGMPEALDFIRARGRTGGTVAEYRGLYGHHHGIASSRLSNLHRCGLVALLEERRGGCGIYILPEHVQPGEATVPHRSNKKAQEADSMIRKESTSIARAIRDTEIDAPEKALVALNVAKAIAPNYPTFDMEAFFALATSDQLPQE